jgi:alkylhydroperoxidase family enzyme
VDSAPIPEPDKALYRFVERVNADSPTLTAADLVAVREAGWTDEALYDAITVCALFNFYNRWIDAAGVHALPDEAHRAGAIQMRDGYVRE